MLNRVFLHGRLTKDPDLRTTASGIAVCRITIAVDQTYSKDGDKKTDFIDCIAWRKTAEFVDKYFSKGTAIIIEGSLHNNNYEDKNGVKHYSYTVTAENVYFAESKKPANGTSAANGDDSFAEEVLVDGEMPF